MGFRRERVIERAVNSEKDVQEALWRMGNSKQWPIMIGNNVSLCGWEADFIGVTRSGFAHEIEIKVSKGDLKSDINAIEENGRKSPSTKVYKYKVLSGKIDGSPDGQYKVKPNYFWFAVPSSLTSDAISLVPSYMGVITVLSPTRMEEERQPKRIHREKLTIANYVDLSTALSARYWEKVFL